MAVDQATLKRSIAGLDALELAEVRRRGTVARLWSAAWPKMAAIVVALAAWQLVVWSGWRPPYVLPRPGVVFADLAERAGHAAFWEGVLRTLRRAATGYGLAVVVGSLLGAVISRSRVLRSAVGSLITGLQTMPSIAWFPFAILMFKLNESAIMFVVVLGAAPSIANGLISGVDHIPPLLLRSGRMLGARRLQLYRHVILPASLPAFVAGLKQGWAFAWRSLMAGELLVIIPGRRSIGADMQFARDNIDAPGLMATMIVILVIGIVADTLFTRMDAVIRRRWGLIDAAA